jgi:UDP-2,3-diacylglucosamine pyrophosphatase LpxH
MAVMKRLIIADAHVGQSHGDAAAMCDHVRRAADSGFGEIIYLGDAFQYLIGMSKFWTTSVRRVLESWREIRSREVGIRLVEGNRDFFLDAADLEREVDWSGRRYEFTAGSTRYRLDHGDLVNSRDFQYLFWSRVSKSWPARLWARLLPRPVAVAIVRHMEARLAATNRKFRYRKPVEDLQRSAESAWDDGVEVLFWGHFHTAWRTGRDGRLAMVIPAWLENRCSVAVEADGSWRLVDLDLAEADPAVLHIQ